MPGSLFPSAAEIDDLLVGPDSVTWQFTSDARLYAAMLYPLLLQVAHPTVGAGVRDYSDFERRPWDRLMRTIDYVNMLAYGGRDAVSAGQRLRALHKTFRGQGLDGGRYSALEPDAYAWVHATLIDTYVRASAHFGRRMDREQTRRFYREYRGLGRLIGVRECDLPPDWEGFREYFDDMVEHRLGRNVSVERVLGTVAHAAPPPLPIPDLVWRAMRLPAGRALWLGGVGLMPTRLRERLGIRWGRLEAAQFELLGASSRALTPVLPDRLRVMGPRHLRWRAEEIAGGPLGSTAAGASQAA